MASADLPPDPGQSGGTARTPAAGAAGVLRFSPPSSPATMARAMRLTVHGLARPPVTAALLGLVVAAVLAACATSTPASEPPAGSAPPVGPSTPAPAPTAVPGGVTPEPLPAGTRIPTTQTEWGEILDAVPPDFPVHPGAEPAEALDAPASAAWLVPVDADAARWYEARLREQGWGTVELGSALEDGSQVLDAWADLPECRMQVVFRPLDGSTMITVLYAAACAGG